MGIPELVLKPEQFNRFSSLLGAKTLNLKKLADAGYNVPKFLAVPSQVCSQLFITDAEAAHGAFDEKLLADVVEAIQKNLGAAKYAVRSSALIEDVEGSSMAGQFSTELDIEGHELRNPIRNVISQASVFLHGDLSKFSLLIQEYIEPDFAGVLFTRDPQGGRETVMEYHRGRGEEVVSGTIRPVTAKFYRPHFPIIHDLPGFKEEAQKFIALENLFGFAQDVEWCMKGSTWYYLQSRPLTTISEIQNKQNLFLEEKLPKEGDFLYEKNEISEIAPAPTPFTWSLLQKIYAHGGPIERVYKKYGVDYRANPFLLRIGNELFTDKEMEIRNLLPSYSYFGRNGFKPHFAHWKGLGLTIKNLFAFNGISSSSPEIFHAVREKLSEKMMVQEAFSVVLKSFLETYELIFEINLLAEKALKILEAAIGREPVTMPELLSSEFPFIQEENEPDVEGLTLMKGNALEIANEDPFVHSALPQSADQKVDNWWKTLAPWKQPYYRQLILQASKYSKLREYGRWLTVKKISELRNVALQLAKNEGFREVRDIYFAEVDEISGGHQSETGCIQRKRIYHDLAAYKFPSKLTSRVIDEVSRLRGVSAGKSTGKLLRPDHKTDLRGAILYTKILAPDLTRYFGQISGIVSEEGGMLSHLAIMARENKIPVVVGFQLRESGIQIGDKVEIDGGAGTVVKESLQ